MGIAKIGTKFEPVIFARKVQCPTLKETKKPIKPVKIGKQMANGKR